MKLRTIQEAMGGAIKSGAVQAWVDNKKIQARKLPPSPWNVWEDVNTSYIPCFWDNEREWRVAQDSPVATDSPMNLSHWRPGMVFRENEKMSVLTPVAVDKFGIYAIRIYAIRIYAINLGSSPDLFTWDQLAVRFSFSFDNVNWFPCTVEGLRIQREQTEGLIILKNNLRDPRLYPRDP